MLGTIMRYGKNINVLNVHSFDEDAPPDLNGDVSYFEASYLWYFGGLLAFKVSGSSLPEMLGILGSFNVSKDVLMDFSL